MTTLIIANVIGVICTVLFIADITICGFARKNK